MSTPPATYGTGRVLPPPTSELVPIHGLKTALNCCRPGYRPHPGRLNGPQGGRVNGPQSGRPKEPQLHWTHRSGAASSASLTATRRRLTVSAPRTAMHRLQEVVRLYRLGTGVRERARLLGMSTRTEREYRVALQAAGQR